jgi:hypothetical protein
MIGLRESTCRGDFGFIVRTQRGERGTSHGDGDASSGLDCVACVALQCCWRVQSATVESQLAVQHSRLQGCKGLESRRATRYISRSRSPVIFLSGNATHLMPNYSPDRIDNLLPSATAARPLCASTPNIIRLLETSPSISSLIGT